MIEVGRVAGKKDPTVLIAVGDDIARAPAGRPPRGIARGAISTSPEKFPAKIEWATQRLGPEGSANTCEGKKAYFTRARDVGDFRTTAVLRTYVPTRGCGFLGGRDCWPCMHKDGSLKLTIQAIDDRAPKR